MRISNSTSKLKVTFIDKKAKSTALGLSDSYKGFDGKFINFYWNCTCISKAKQVADSLEKGDFVTIGDADVFIRENSKDNGSMLVMSMQQVSSPYGDEKKTPVLSEEKQAVPDNGSSYGYESDTEDEPF